LPFAWPIIQALTRAAVRSVKVRIYLDSTQLADREPAGVFLTLVHTPGVEIRTKRSKGAPMHLKSYQIDGQLLRAGAANFSASGLKRQGKQLRRREFMRTMRVQETIHWKNECNYAAERAARVCQNYQYKYFKNQN
jgi:phosphatidylserine/phosphatidylglycerophosphate/cardiolipin synthase-like enzyme